MKHEIHTLVLFWKLFQMQPARKFIKRLKRNRAIGTACLNSWL